MNRDAERDESERELDRAARALAKRLYTSGDYSVNEIIYELVYWKYESSLKPEFQVYARWARNHAHEIRKRIVQEYVFEALAGSGATANKMPDKGPLRPSLFVEPKRPISLFGVFDRYSCHRRNIAMFTDCGSNQIPASWSKMLDALWSKIGFVQSYLRPDLIIMREKLTEIEKSAVGEVDHKWKLMIEFFRQSAVSYTNCDVK